MQNAIDVILLVDDTEATNFLNRIVIEEMEICKEVRAFLKSEGAEQYLQEIAATGTNPSLIIFLDINMPGMSGWEFLQRFQEKYKPKLENAVVIMVTSSIMESDRTKAFEKGVDGFISKPLLGDDIQDIINRHF